MGLILESTKVFNSLRNNDDFLTLPGDFTTTVKANVGEKLKIVSKFRASWSISASITTNANQFIVGTVAGGKSITATSQDFDVQKFRKDDFFDVIIHSGAGAGSYVGNQITLISGNYIEFIDSGGVPLGTHNDADIHGTSDLDKLVFKYNFPASSDSDNLISVLFGLIPTFDFPAITILGGDVVGVPRTPLYYVSGGMVARRLATVNTYEQVYEVELIVIVPYFNEGEFNNLITKVKPLPFSVESKFYKEAIELQTGGNAVTNRPFDLSRTVNDSLGWFNENFHGGGEDYSVLTVTYQEVTNFSEIDRPEMTVQTKVIVEIASLVGAEFTATDPVITTFSYLPSTAAARSPSGDFQTNWNFDSVRMLIDGAPVNSSIITACTAVLNDPNKITIEYLLGFSVDQIGRMVNGGEFETATQLEKPSHAPEDANRMNLIIDANTLTKNNDISGLLTVLKDDVYYHTDDFNEGVTEGATDLIGWNEELYMRDISFEMMTVSDQLIQIDQLYAEVIMYNTTTKDFSVIDSVAIPTAILGKVVSTSGTLYHKINTDTTRAFKLPPGSNLNFLKLKDTTFLDPLQKYSMQVGMFMPWQYWLALLGVDPVFIDTNEPQNGLNKRSSNYSGVNNYEIRLSLLFKIKKNNGDFDVVTDYRSISPTSEVYNFDENSDFTRTVVYKDENDQVLTKVGGIGYNPENAIVKVIVTWDDGGVKTSAMTFDAVAMLEVKEQGTQRSKEFISSVFGVKSGLSLEPLPSEIGILKSIVGGNYTAEFQINTSLLSVDTYYSISPHMRVVFSIFNPFLIVQYDASGLITNTNNEFGDVNASDEVVIWKNLIGDALFDVTTGVSTNRPLLDNINKRVVFDGINDVLRSGTFNIDIPITLCFCGSRLNSPTAPFIQFNHTAGGTNTDIQEFASFIKTRIRPYESAAGDISSASVSVSQRFAIVVHFVAGSSPTWYTQFYPDVTNPSLSTVTTTSSEDMVASAGFFNFLQMGRSIAGASYMECEMNEILMYTKNLTVNEGESVVQYFKAKWG